MGAHLWPGTFVRLFASALPEELVSEVRDEADLIAQCPNYWTSKDNLVQGKCQTAAERAVKAIHHRLAKTLSANNCAGAEWWVQTYDFGKGLAFHFDKDEKRLKCDGVMIHPVLSSIVYLTGVAEHPCQGPTVILDQRFDAACSQACPEQPASCALIFPRTNSFCLFDGGLGHGVLESASQQKRITLLINWWAEQPQGICPMTLQSTPKHVWGRLCRLRERTAHRDGNNGSLKDANTLPSAPQRSHDSHSSSPAIGASEGDVADYGAVPATLHVIDLAEQDANPPSAILVDDLLASYGICVQKESRAFAVAIRHPGRVLYPIDPEQCVCTAAALVPEDAVPHSSEVSCEDSRDDSMSG